MSVPDNVKHTVDVLLWDQPPVAPNPSPSYLPRLKLRQAWTCTPSTMRVEPCVLRGALSKAELDGFVRLNKHQEFSVRDVASTVGSFTYAGTGMNAIRLDADDTRQTTLGRLVHHGSARGTYRNAAAFNYSSYAPILRSLMDAGVFEGTPYPDRADTFLGDLPRDKATAMMHSEPLEVSTSVQLVGEKLWNFMTPDCWSREQQTFQVGAAYYAYYVGADAWERCEVTSVLARPGDVVIIPKAWPHQLFTLAGPNVMANFRSDAVDLTNPVDVAALIMVKILRMRETKVSTCSAAASTPSSFGHGGAPTPSSWIGRKKREALSEVDLRHCLVSGGIAHFLTKYLDAVRRNAPDDAAGRHVLRQLRRFHGLV
eukprot:CAMPEP_0202790500 /NCGR_PEP_ID=MMETSP1388-20130828/79573_1 /ASSEMBLY_ACC=CAM_ASM_000864 /TAXON_ID=37098 /ORGANISM="Isochrysis sp, Strain CCMP1244" /LENGTH=369 /DNA_ID=CAMNT_0049460231 /DNA_START=33 /DNA_END=1142 /DNA_ORIENTATION=-